VTWLNSIYDTYVRHDGCVCATCLLSCRTYTCMLQLVLQSVAVCCGTHTHVRHHSSLVAHTNASCLMYIFARTHYSNLFVWMCVYDMTNVHVWHDRRHFVYTHSYMHIRLMFLCECVCTTWHDARVYVTWLLSCCTCTWPMCMRDMTNRHDECVCAILLLSCRTYTWYVYIRTWTLNMVRISMFDMTIVCATWRNDMANVCVRCNSCHVAHTRRTYTFAH